MVTGSVFKWHQSNSGLSVPGCCKLMPGRAISLRPRKAGVLQIAQGQVWATVDGPHQGHGNESGDHFLQAGQHLGVRAGQHLVFEPWCAYGMSEATVCFEWTPNPAAVTAPASLWRLAVAEPLRDLLQALRMAGLAGRERAP